MANDTKPSEWALQAKSRNMVGYVPHDGQNRELTPRLDRARKFETIHDAYYYAQVLVASAQTLSSYRYRAVPAVEPEFEEPLVPRVQISYYCGHDFSERRFACGCVETIRNDRNESWRHGCAAHEGDRR